MSKQISIDDPVMLETNSGSVAYITAKVNNKTVGIPIIKSSNNSINLVQPTMNMRLKNPTLYTKEDVKPFVTATGQHVGIAFIMKDHVYAVPLFEVPDNEMDTITLNFTETTFVVGLSAVRSKGKPMPMIVSKSEEDDDTEESNSYDGLSGEKNRPKQENVGYPISLIISINDSNYGIPLCRFTHLYNIQNGKTVDWSVIKPRWYNDKDGDGKKTVLTDEEKRRRFYPKDSKHTRPLGPRPIRIIPHFWRLYDFPFRSYVFDGHLVKTADMKMPPTVRPPDIKHMYHLKFTDTETSPEEAVSLLNRCINLLYNTILLGDDQYPEIPEMKTGEDMINVMNTIIDVFGEYFEYEMDEITDVEPEEGKYTKWMCDPLDYNGKHIGIEMSEEDPEHPQWVLKADTEEIGDRIDVGDDDMELVWHKEGTPPNAQIDITAKRMSLTMYFEVLYQLNILVENLKWLNTPEFWEYSRHDDGHETVHPYRPSLSRDYRYPSGVWLYERPTPTQELRWHIKTMLSVGKPTIDFGSDYGSTYLNNKVTAYSDLVKRIKMQFGWPNVEPDICDENIAENIDQAIELYSKYAGYTEEYLVFHTRLYKPGAGIRLDKLFSMTNDIHSQDMEGNEIDMDYDIQNYRKVLNCFSVEPGESTGINTLFTLESALAQQCQFAYLLGEGRGFDLTSYTAVKTYLDTREKVLSQKIYFRFDPYTQYLRFIPEPRRIDPYLGVVGCYVEKPIRELLIEKWVFEYALALTMVIVGRLRSKYTIQMLGGSTLRGDEILNAGLQAKKELEEQLFKGTGWVESQPAFFIG